MQLVCFENIWIHDPVKQRNKLLLNLIEQNINFSIFTFLSLFFVSLTDDIDKADENSYQSTSVLHRRQALPYNILCMMTGERDDTDEVKQYTRLVGKALSQSILLYRPWIYSDITVYHDIHVYNILQTLKQYFCMIG